MKRCHRDKSSVCFYRFSSLICQLPPLAAGTLVTGDEWIDGCPEMVSRRFSSAILSFRGRHNTLTEPPCCENTVETRVTPVIMPLREQQPRLCPEVMGNGSVACETLNARLRLTRRTILVMRHFLDARNLGRKRPTLFSVVVKRSLFT